MATRVFLHVGTPKSGTTFLQSVWWANKPQLRERGLLLPGAGVHEHYWASCVIRGGQQPRHIPEAGLAAWDRILHRAERFPGDVLISHELFSPASARRAEKALRDLDSVADEVHVVLTARDLVRQIPAEWQQRTKHGRAETFAEFLRRIQNEPSMNFWRVQDVPAVLSRWGQGIPSHRVHLVVLPPPAGPRDFLWEATCQLFGIDGADLRTDLKRDNQSLGLVEAETMRRVSGVLGHGGMAKSTERLLKDFFAEEVLRSTDPERIVLPIDAHPWAVQRAQRMVHELADRGYHVVGNLADLVPSTAPAHGRDPGEVSDSEVAETAVLALARFVQHEEESRKDLGRLEHRLQTAERARVGRGVVGSWREWLARAARVSRR